MKNEDRKRGNLKWSLLAIVSFLLVLLLFFLLFTKPLITSDTPIPQKYEYVNTQIEEEPITIEQTEIQKVYNKFPNVDMEKVIQVELQEEPYTIQIEEPKEEIIEEDTGRNLINISVAVGIVGVVFTEIMGVIQCVY